jgi:alpha-beta hydrolase superfamily lysophospholipase
MKQRELNASALEFHAPSPEIEEGFLHGGGVRLFSCWHPVPDPVGIVVLTHGLGEHSGRYGHVIHHFQKSRLAVLRYDLRGHGRSDGSRGHADSFEQLLDDLSLVTQVALRKSSDLPIVQYGHSLGGNIAANWCLRRFGEAPQTAALVTSSPWFLLSHPPATWKVGLIRSLSRIWPELRIPAGFRTKNLTRNPEAAAAYEGDPLNHREISVRLAIEAYDAAAWALAHAEECRMSVLGVHGQLDTVTSVAGTRLFCERAPSATFMEFNGLVHEPHNEPEWHEVVCGIRDWIVSRLAGWTGPLPVTVRSSEGNAPGIAAADLLSPAADA